MLGCTCIFKSYIYRRQAKTKKTYVTAGANLKKTNIIYGERKLPYYLAILSLVSQNPPGELRGAWEDLILDKLTHVADKRVMSYLFIKRSLRDVSRGEPPQLK